MRNPPAFDKFLLDHYEQLIKVVPPEWLPLPILVASRAAREIERLTYNLESAKKYYTAEEQRDVLALIEKNVALDIAKQMKKTQTRKGFKEYGAGHYGVVYPTQKPGIVCKITTDYTEAQTVANLLTWEKQPYGMVRYYSVFRFKDRSHKNRPVYILWRDEMQPITLAYASGAAGPRHAFRKGVGSYEQRMEEILHYTKHVAHTARVWIQAAMRRSWKQDVSFKRVYDDIAWAREHDNDFYYDNLTQEIEQSEPYWFTKRIARQPFRTRMAHVLFLLRYGWRDLMSFSYGFHPGNALYECLEHDMLLADVHANNVMKAQDGSWDISDPGHMIELSNRYAHVQIPTL